MRTGFEGDANMIRYVGPSQTSAHEMRSLKHYEMHTFCDGDANMIRYVDPSQTSAHEMHSLKHHEMHPFCDAEPIAGMSVTRSH